jgi:hypothetical protein
MARIARFAVQFSYTLHSLLFACSMCWFDKHDGHNMNARTCMCTMPAG